MEQKLFSVIIPTFNCGRKLAATLNSVLLAQPRELCEIIVVDGGSTQETLSIIAEHERELTVVSEIDGGIYDAFNKGVTLSSGKYLYFLGAGDCLRAGVLARLARVLPAVNETATTTTVAAVVYGDTYLVQHEQLYGGEFRMRDFHYRNVCHQSIFYERAVFDRLGGFDLKYKLYADWAFNLRCFADPCVRKTYLNLVIADFEGWGLSDGQLDARFMADLPRLIRRHMGVYEYLHYRAYLVKSALSIRRRTLAAAAATHNTAGRKRPASPPERPIS